MGYQRRVHGDRCDFRVGDMVGTGLAEASAVFLYLPVVALRTVLTRVFPRSGIQRGTTIFSADGQLPSACTVEQFQPPNSRRAWIQKTEHQGLFCYTFVGDQPKL